MRKPNILFILADDMGYGDIASVNGGLSETPHIDGLIRDGVFLTNHYSASTLCAPARASLMTGRYPHRTGVVDTLAVNGLNNMKLDETTVAQVLQNGGYCTGLFGKWHLGPNGDYHPHSRGFDETVLMRSHDHWKWKVDRDNGPVIESDGRYLADMLTDEAVDFVSRHRNEPFFLYLAHYAPHCPLQAPEEDVAPFLNREGINEHVAKLYGMIRRMDAGIGRLLGTLDELGLREDTLVVFASDNGPQFCGGGSDDGIKRFNCGLRGFKDLVYEGGIRVPMVMRWPGRFKPSSTCDDFAHFTDWFPTLLAAAGIPLPDTLAIDGINMLPTLCGEERSDFGGNERERYWQFSRYAPIRTHNAAAREGHWKLVRPPCPEVRVFKGPDVRASIDYEDHPERFPDGPPPASYTPTYPDRLPVELYDLSADPEEAHNRAAEHPELVAELERQFDDWFDEVERDRARDVE